MPNERDDASTVEVEVEFPTDHPIPFVSVQPVPGWTIDVERTTLDEPIEGEGSAITDVVSRITWSGGEIAPGQFQTFPVSMGPLPDDTDELVFKALQTYSSGEIVRWIEEPVTDGSEPEHPAPTLELAAATAGEPADDASESATGEDSSDDDSTGFAIVALVAGVLGLAAGVAALVTSRRGAG